MASNQLSFTGFEPEIQDISRQRDLAKMLLQKGMADNLQGQMVSGRYVGASPLQGIANVYSAYKGKQLSEESDKKQAELAQRLRQLQATEAQDILGALKGKPEVASIIPEGQTLRDDQAQLTMGSVAGTPAVEGSPQNALAVALRGQSPFSQTMATKLMERQFKEPSWKEISQYNPKTGDTENYRYDANSTDPRSTMQFLGVGKPALTRADQIRFADEGINTNIGNASAPVVAPAGGVIPPVVSPAGGAVSTIPVVAKPATTAKNDDLVKAFGYDPFKPPPPPSNISSGKDLRNYTLDQAKPLTGTAADQVTGAKLYTDSLIKYNDYVNSLQPSDLLNPSVRVKLTSLHSQAKLAGKEANKLGVLNGGDERILEEVLPNYKDITVTKKNLNNLIQGQKEFGTSVIVNAYGTQQKAVPENMRKYVVVPKEVGSETKKPSTTTQRAVLNGENIVVKNGKWVYERTGKVVE